MKVVDGEEGNVITGAYVRLIAESPGSGQPIQSLVNDRGVVVFSNVSPAAYRVRTMRVGLLFSEDRVIATAGSTDSLTVRMRWSDDLCLTVTTSR